MSDISRRKADHLDLATSGDVGFRRTTSLFECVRLVHDALPDLDFAAIDPGVELLGKRLRVPLLIAAMTGGTERAQRINHELAAIAEQRGCAFGLGSQRAMHKNPATSASYQVRAAAPTTLVLGNIGIVQAGQMKSEQVAELVQAVGADALCVHLNPAMELVQAEGDRDFRGGLATISRLLQELGTPIVVKETGCGLSSEVAGRLRAAGVEHVDVSGAGGTSWVAVETERASAERRGLGETFREWGIPTAASVALVSGRGFATLFATGGISNGLEVAKAIALGASAAGIARPLLKALEGGGREAALAMLERIETELRMAMLLVGAKDLKGLRRAQRVITGELGEWIRQAG
jgi:isopentenyl-diphosphate Delta-isomerase